VKVTDLSGPRIKSENPRELRAERAELLDDLNALIDKAERENRDFTSAEERNFEKGKNLSDKLYEKIQRLERVDVRAIERAGGILEKRQAPYMKMNHELTGEDRAFTEWVRTGQKSELLYGDSSEIELRAIVDSSMNITTNATWNHCLTVGISGARPNRARSRPGPGRAAGRLCSIRSRSRRSFRDRWTWTGRRLRGSRLGVGGGSISKKGPG